MAAFRHGRRRRRASRRKHAESRTHDWQVWGVRLLLWGLHWALRELWERAREGWWL